MGGGIPNLKEIVQKLRLGDYRRDNVSNINNDMEISDERLFFDMGLRLLFSYQHELASYCLLQCLELNDDIVLAHGLVALCHSPNYNFKGEPYYGSGVRHHHEDEGVMVADVVSQKDVDCIFPSQQLADRHSAAAVDIVEEIKNNNKVAAGGGGRKKKTKGRRRRLQPKPSANSQNGTAMDEEEAPDVPAAALVTAAVTTVLDVEVQFLAAVRILTSSPGIDSCLSEEIVGRPYADAMRKVYQKYPHDADMAYFFAESLMVLNAWKLYEYPSGRPLSPHVDEIRAVLERALDANPHHPGCCHMYVHLSEMSATPQQALRACPPLRTELHHAGHLIHMPTHIDVLIGNYEECIRTNCVAIAAGTEMRDLCPKTAGLQSFYFGYIVHNYHMAVYGAILGAMEQKGLEIANALNDILCEAMFVDHPLLVSYLEAYSSLEVHVMVRFGRWDDILQVPMPHDQNLMLYRTATILYARALALAIKGDVTAAAKEADRYDSFRLQHRGEAESRILHNNTVASLLELDSVMLRGELLYRQGKHLPGLTMLRKAVTMQDALHYDDRKSKKQKSA
jgi:hypothetical protein